LARSTGSRTRGVPAVKGGSVATTSTIALSRHAWAEAHNNLAFSLRMQGTQHVERALHHYHRALELKPDLARAYLYRGVLFTQIGDLGRARADHAKLLELDPELAAKLERIIAGTGGRDENDGLAAAYD